MEIGAFFILLIVLVVVAILGVAVYALTMRLRHKQLDPEGDKVEGVPARRLRPQHVRVEGNQRTRFVDTR